MPISFLRTAVCAVALIHGAGAFADEVDCDKCVDTSDIAKQAVNSARIKDETVKAKDMSAGAKPAGANYAENVDPGQAVELNSDFAPVIATAMDLPGPGTVIISVGGYVRFDSNPARVECAITRDDEEIGPNWFIGGSNAVAELTRQPVASTRGFTEDGAGLRTYKLLCRESDGDAQMYWNTITAVFAPQDYAAPAGATVITRAADAPDDAR